MNLKKLGFRFFLVVVLIAITCAAFNNLYSDKKAVGGDLPTPTTVENFNQKNAGAAEVVSLSRASPAPEREVAQVDLKPISAQLISRYNEGTSMRSFVDFALQHPEMGGAFYATKVLTQCRGFMASNHPGLKSTTDSNSLDGNVLASMANALQKLESRCSEFLPDEVSNRRDREILDEGRTKGDPLVAASDAFIKSLGVKGAAGVTAKASALEKVLELQDPVLLEDLGLRLAITEDSKSGQRGYFLNNRFYSLNDSTDVGHSIYLLPCGVGLDCGASDFDTATRCASGSGCAIDRFSYIKNLYVNNEDGYDRVIGLYNILLEDVKKKNAAAFVQQSSK